MNLILLKEVTLRQSTLRRDSKNTDTIRSLYCYVDNSWYHI